MSTHTSHSDLLVKTLLELLEKNFPEIDEVGVIPGLPEGVQNVCDASPEELFIVVERRLGIYSGCLRGLFLTAYKAFMQVHKANTSAATRSASGSAGSDPSTADHSGAGPASSTSTLDSELGLTRVLALIYGESMTSWNVRKRYVEDGCVCSVCELRLTKLALDMRAKIPEVFIHMRFVTSHLLAQPTVKPSVSGLCAGHESIRHGDSGHCHPRCSFVDGVFRTELQTCTTAANHYKSHYTAWQHRQWLLQYLIQQSGCCAGTVCSFLDSELRTVEAWVSRNVSQFSGMSYLLNLIHLVCHIAAADSGCAATVQPGIADVQEQLRAWLTARLAANESLLTSFPEHEALWKYRQGLLQIVVYHSHLCAEGRLLSTCWFAGIASELQTSQDAARCGNGAPQDSASERAVDSRRTLATLQVSGLQLPMPSTELFIHASQGCLVCNSFMSHPQFRDVFWKRDRGSGRASPITGTASSSIDASQSASPHHSVDVCLGCQRFVRHEEFILSGISQSSSPCGWSQLVSRHYQFLKRLSPAE